MWTYGPTLLPWSHHLHTCHRGSKLSFNWKSVLNSDGMCGDGDSMAIMLDHRSTALGRNFNSQVLKHGEFMIVAGIKSTAKLWPEIVFKQLAKLNCAENITVPPPPPGITFNHIPGLRKTLIWLLLFYQIVSPCSHNLYEYKITNWTLNDALYFQVSTLHYKKYSRCLSGYGMN